MGNKTAIAGPPATFWVRAAAQVLDAIILVAFFLFLGVIMAVVLPNLNGVKDRMIPILYAVYIGVPCLYFTITTALWGQTPGKKVFNLKVARVDGQPVSFLGSFWRWFSYLFSSIPFGLGYILAGIVTEKRALHDYTSGTKVVQIGPANQTLMILLLVLPFGSIPIVGILAAIAIPRFAQMLEKSREGVTKQNLAALKAAVFAYKKDHVGKPPRDLEKDLVPKYLEEIPLVKATGAFVANAASPMGSRVTPASPGRVPTTSGEGWLYDPSLGKVYVNSTVKDSKSVPYSFYGWE